MALQSSPPTTCRRSSSRGSEARPAGFGITWIQYQIRTKGLGVLVLGFLGAEFLVVVEPFNALLGSGVGYTAPGVACAGAATAAVGIAAHARERFGRSAEAAKVAGDQSGEAHAVSLHNSATMTLLVAVGLSIAARVTQAYYGDGVSITNMSAFIALQLVFLLGALVFPAFQRDLGCAARARHVLDAHVEVQRADKATAEEVTSEVAEHHQSTLSDFDAGAEVRAVRYLAALADTLAVPYLADLVRREASGVRPSDPVPPPPEDGPETGNIHRPAGPVEPESGAGFAPPARDARPARPTGRCRRDPGARA